MERKHEIAGVFGRAAPTYDQIGPKPFAHVGRRLVERAGLRPSDEVLDVATGRGAVLIPAAERVARAVGIDLAEPMVAGLAGEIAARGQTNVEAVVMDAERLEFADESFDVVLCNLSIFFFDAERALREFRRVLRPGGRLAFTDFGPGDPRWSWYRELLASLRGGGPPAPKETAQQTDEGRSGHERRLAAAGFERVAFAEETYDLRFADADEWWSWIWSHGQRGVLEQLDEAALERFRTEAWSRLPDPIVNTWTVVFVLARRA